jgi:two-component system sensor histidine kinase YesM
MESIRKGLTLRQKIVLFGTLMIALPTMVVWAASSFLFYSEQDRNAREMMSNTLRQIMMNIDGQIEMAAATCNNIAFDPTLIRYLHSARTGNLDDAEILDGLFYLNKLIANYEAVNTDAEISLYISEPELLASNNSRYIALSEAPEHVLEAMEERNASSLILAPTDYVGRGYSSIRRKYYTVVQSVSGKTPAQGIWALVVARIEASALHNVIDDISTDPRSYVCLHDGNEVFFLRRGGREILWPYGASILELESGRLDLEGERYTVLRVGSAKTGWELMTLVSQNSYMGASHRTAVIALATGLAFAILASLLAVRYFAGIAKRLEQLGNHMRLAAQGEYDTPIALGGDEELQALQNSYNDMIRIINTLIEDRYRQQLNLQYCELKALENQIKPHFLYNTLDVLKFKALRAGAREVASNLDDMARYFRTALAGGHRFLTLLDEAEHCRLYVRLQNFRYGDSIELDEDIPGEVAFCSMLRFLLQPLIENAVVHGIRKRPGRSGKISLSACREGETLVIRVVDNGVGMPAEMLAQSPGTRRAGFGVSNVHSRIQVFYGADYGLSFPWSKESGTCAELRIPYELDSSYAGDAADVDPAELDPAGIDPREERGR